MAYRTRTTVKKKKRERAKKKREKGGKLEGYSSDDPCGQL
jgi:hypothetical protein